MCLKLVEEPEKHGTAAGNHFLSTFNKIMSSGMVLLHSFYKLRPQPQSSM